MIFHRPTFLNDLKILLLFAGKDAFIFFFNFLALSISVIDRRVFEAKDNFVKVFAYFSFDVFLKQMSLGSNNLLWTIDGN